MSPSSALPQPYRATSHPVTLARCLSFPICKAGRSCQAEVQVRGKGVALGNGVLLLKGTFTAIRDPDLCDKPTPYQNSLSLAWGEKPALG